MKIIVTEKQIKLLTQSLDEQEETETEPYPEVGKWESGVTRGPGNQITGKTKWSDIVGSTITRGKANPLK